MINPKIKINDIKIKSTGFWNCSGLIADEYYKNNIFLTGDACHSFPPAGGYGMNTGL